MDEIKLLRAGTIESGGFPGSWPGLWNLRRRWRIGGRISECAPHAFERACLGIKHYDSSVAMPVGYELLVCFGINGYVRRSVQIVGVRVAFALPFMADLHHELSRI